MSVLFKGEDIADDDQYKIFDILLINKDREILVNPLEDLDDEEKFAVLADIINSDPVQN